MIEHIVNLIIPNATAEQFYDFMITPTDEKYSLWWPGEHLQYHIIKPGDETHLGDVVYVDERLGDKHRLTCRAVATVADRPKRIVAQMIKAGIRLPAFIELEFRDSPDGLLLKHELRLGWRGAVGKVFDRLIRIYFNKSFQSALETHCGVEWYKLAELLKQEDR